MKVSSLFHICNKLQWVNILSLIVLITKTKATSNITKTRATLNINTPLAAGISIQHQIVSMKVKKVHLCSQTSPCLFLPFVMFRIIMEILDLGLEISLKHHWNSSTPVCGNPGRGNGVYCSFDTALCYNICLISPVEVNLFYVLER